MTTQETTTKQKECIAKYGFQLCEESQEENDNGVNYTTLCNSGGNFNGVWFPETYTDFETTQEAIQEAFIRIGYRLKQKAKLNAINKLN